MRKDIRRFYDGDGDGDGDNREAPLPSCPFTEQTYHFPPLWAGKNTLGRERADIVVTGVLRQTLTGREPNIKTQHTRSNDVGGSTPASFPPPAK